MHAQGAPLDSSKAIRITFTDKPVTAVGGVALVVAFARRIGLAPKLAEMLPFVLAVLQADVPVQQLFGLTRFPSTATFTRFFRRFTPKAITETFEPLWMWSLDRLPAQSQGYTLDLDSSVVERYGTQEGALKGSPPKKCGRPSHHPRFAMLAEARCIAHVWLRSGNTASAPVGRPPSSPGRWRCVPGGSTLRLCEPTAASLRTRS